MNECIRDELFSCVLDLTVPMKCVYGFARDSYFFLFYEVFFEHHINDSIGYIQKEKK